VTIKLFHGPALSLERTRCSMTAPEISGAAFQA
jgi:hypothetical protein